MSKCAVKGCANVRLTGKNRKNQDVSFHRVPHPLKRPKDYLRWADVIDKNLSFKSQICSIHFEDGDYTYNPTVRKLLSRGGRPTLRPGVVPHLNLDIRRKTVLLQRNENDLNEIQVKEEKQEEEHFPQETVYLPASSTEFLHEYSDSEESSASSDGDLAGVPFQERTYMSQPVQCELGTEKYRRYLLGYISDDEDEPGNDVESRPYLLTGDSTSDVLTGISTAPEVTLSENHDVQCELGREVYRWKTRRVVTYGRYDMCLSGGNCPCGLPKPDSDGDALKRRNVFSSEKNGNSEAKEDSDGDELKIRKTFFNDKNENSEAKEDSDGDALKRRKTFFSNKNENLEAKEDSDKDNSESEKRGANDNACLVCEQSKFLYMEEPKSMVFTVTQNNRNKVDPPRIEKKVDLPQIRKKVASIIHKRSGPNILRRNQRPK